MKMPLNQFDLEIKGHMKVVMLPHPLSDSSSLADMISLLCQKIKR